MDAAQFAATGALYDKLCAVDGDGLCTFPSTVKLTEDMACDGARSAHPPHRRGRGRRNKHFIIRGAERLC